MVRAPRAGHDVTVSTIARRVVVHGSVQGVFFRDTCRRQARAAGVSGWVRNRADGTVEALFEGTPGAVQSMVDWAHSGPTYAVVERVEVSAAEPGHGPGFEVRD
jgi:acylphosphatase